MSHGLAPRPELPADEMAALMAVAEEMISEQLVQSVAVDPVPSWRFSGRWFNSGLYANRRPLRPM
jgi:hypothetical protein